MSRQFPKLQTTSSLQDLAQFLQSFRHLRRVRGHGRTRTTALAAFFFHDAGDSSLPTPTEEEMAASVPSPYGVWGALGTIDSGEVANEF